MVTDDSCLWKGLGRSGLPQTGGTALPLLLAAVLAVSSGAFAFVASLAAPRWPSCDGGRRYPVFGVASTLVVIGTWCRGMNVTPFLFASSSHSRFPPGDSMLGGDLRRGCCALCVFFCGTPLYSPYCWYHPCSMANDRTDSVSKETTPRCALDARTLPYLALELQI